MPKARILTQQAIPGSNLGEAFTASIAQRQVNIQVGEGYWDSLSLGFKGDGAVAAVTLEAFLDLVQPLTVIENEPRISMRGTDLFALSTAFYEASPQFVEGAIGQDMKVFGIRVPLWTKPKTTETYGYSITRVAVTNISGEVVTLTLLYDNAVPAGRNPGRIDAREIPFTTGAATGIQQVTNKLPKLGKLLGLLIFSTTVPTVAADLASVQNLFLDTPTARLVSATWGDLQAAFHANYDFVRADASALVKRNVLDNYGWLDFRDEPVDLVANDVALSIDSQSVSTAVRFIPVIEVPQ